MSARQSIPPSASPVSAMEAVPGLVWAFRFRADGSSEELSGCTELEAEANNGWLWVHCNLADARLSPYLRAHAAFPPAAHPAPFSRLWLSLAFRIRRCVAPAPRVFCRPLPLDARPGRGDNGRPPWATAAAAASAPAACGPPVAQPGPSSIGRCCRRLLGHSASWSGDFAATPVCDSLNIGGLRAGEKHGLFVVATGVIQTL